MNRLAIFILIGLSGLLASCGTSTSSSTQPGAHDVFSVFVTPTQFTLNAGDWSTVTATVELSNNNGAPKAVTPQPPIKFFSSDPRVSVSPAGEVCGGQWDTRYLTCTPTTNASGQLDLPTGYVIITAYNASNNVSGTSLVSVHQRAINITLSAPGYAVSEVVPGQTTPITRTCISQTPPNAAPTGANQVQYIATPADGNGNAISNVFANDYVWTVSDSNVASVSSQGFVVARNPGVTNVTATLNGTTSAPLAFVTCPASAIVLASSPVTGGVPTGPFSTADLDSQSKGSQVLMTASLLDMNGNPVTTAPLNYVTSDPLTGSFTPFLPLTSTLTANSPGRFSVVASCAPPTCNNAVPDFVLPLPLGATTGKTAGFGFPIYSNAIGVTVTGIAGSSVLVTGTKLSDGVTAAHILQVYDSEALSLAQTVNLPNTPNSLVVAPNGAKAYLGSNSLNGNSGLMVVDLTSYQSTILNFPVVGGSSTDVVTGTVLGVSSDSRFVLTSDNTTAAPNSLVFLIDTTGSKSATRYSIPGSVNAVTFAADGSNIWIGGTNGVFSFQSNTFVPINAVATNVTNAANVKALAWTPDGQSYFASGDQLFNYSTCDNQFQISPPIVNNTAAFYTPLLEGATSGPIDLSATIIDGAPRVVGLAAAPSGFQWLDYLVSTTAQITPSQLPLPLPQISLFTPVGPGDVCRSTVTVATPGTATLTHTATPVTFSPTQVTFSPTLEQAFVTGVNQAGTAESVIHGYDLNTHAEIAPPLTTASAVLPRSGGVLNDGRFLYFGTYSGATATLHRINLSTTGTSAHSEDASTTVGVVPDFVAVVPK
jgi:hypothetical protein